MRKLICQYRAPISSMTDVCALPIEKHCRSLYRQLFHPSRRSIWGWSHISRWRTRIAATWKSGKDNVSNAQSGKFQSVSVSNTETIDSSVFGHIDFLGLPPANVEEVIDVTGGSIPWQYPHLTNHYASRLSCWGKRKQTRIFLLSSYPTSGWTSQRYVWGYTSDIWHDSSNAVVY